MVGNNTHKAPARDRRAVLEAILNRVAAGMTPDEARKAEQVSPFQFRTWVTKEPDIRERFDKASRHVPLERARALTVLARVAGGMALPDAVEAEGMEAKEFEAVIRKEGMANALHTALKTSSLLAPVRMDAGKAALVLAAVTPYWCEAREHPGEGKLVGLAVRAWPTLAECANEAGMDVSEVYEARKAAPSMWLRMVEVRKSNADAWQQSLDELTRLRALSGLALMVGDREGKRVKKVSKTRTFLDANGQLQERDDVTVTEEKITLHPSVDALKLALGREDAAPSKQMAVTVTEEDAAAQLDELDGMDADDFLNLALGR